MPQKGIATTLVISQGRKSTWSDAIKVLVQVFFPRHECISGDRRRPAAPVLLNHGTRWGGGGCQLHVLRRFTLSKEFWYPLKRRLRRPQIWSSRFGAEINVLPLPEFEPRFVHPVALSLYWLRRIDHKMTCPKHTADIIKSKPTHRHTVSDLYVLSYFEIIKIPANCNWYSLLQILRCSLN
jgi:hypothetical protein